MNKMSDDVLSEMVEKEVKKIDKNDPLRIRRPLLAEKLSDPSLIVFPVYGTPKLDGIRAIKVDGKLVSRNFKPIPNKYTRDFMEGILPDGIDGELMLQDTNNFNAIQSAIMRQTGEPKFKYFAFDFVLEKLEDPYLKRLEDLKSWYETSLLPEHKHLVELILPTTLNSVDELNSFEEKCLSEGFEGIMIRSGDGKYKCGRSTVNEGFLLKLKRFEDEEAIVIGFEERMENTNEQERDEFGLAKRSSKKAGMVGSNTLGNLVVKNEKYEKEYRVGSGFDDELRKKIWDNQSEYLGKLITYRFQPYGMKDFPRFPIFKGFRHKNDL